MFLEVFLVRIKLTTEKAECVVHDFYEEESSLVIVTLGLSFPGSRTNSIPRNGEEDLLSQSHSRKNIR